MANRPILPCAYRNPALSGSANSRVAWIFGAFAAAGTFRAFFGLTFAERLTIWLVLVLLFSICVSINRGPPVLDGCAACHRGCIQSRQDLLARVPQNRCSSGRRRPSRPVGGTDRATEQRAPPRYGLCVLTTGPACDTTLGAS